MNDTMKPPLQSALDALEKARVELVTTLSGEVATVNQKLAELRQKAADLRSEYVAHQQKSELEKLQAVAKRLTQVNAEIQAQERVAKDFESRLDDARQCRSLQLQHLRFKVDHETRAAYAQGAAEDAFRKTVSEDIRRAAASLLASTTPDHARRVILDAFGIAEQTAN